MLLNIADHLLSLAAVTALLGYLGYPIGRLIHRPGRDRPDAVILLCGLGILTGFGWYWSTFSHAGMRAGLPVLMLLNLPVFGASIAGARRRLRVEAQSMIPIARIAALALVVVTLFSVHYPGYFSADEPGPISLGNNDVAFYNLAAQHLNDDGFDDQGKIASHDLGYWTHRDITGAFLLLGSSAVLLGHESWEVTVPVQLLAILLILLSLERLLRLLTRYSHAVCAGTAAVALASGTFFYSSYQGFTAQLLAMAVVFGALGVCLDVADGATSRLSRRDVLGMAAVLAVLEIALVMVYPHMLILLVPMLAALGVVWCVGAGVGFAGAWRSSVRTLGIVAAGSALGVVVLAPRYSVAMGIMTRIGDAPAGWPLGRIGIAQMLGLGRFPRAPTGGVAALAAGDQSWSAGLIPFVAVALIAGAAALGIVRSMPPGAARARVLTTMVALVAPFELYYLLYARYGETYQGWKGGLFLQPLAPACAIALAWTATSTVLAPALRARRLAVPGFFGMAVALMITFAVSKPWTNRFERVVSSELRDLGALHDRFGLNELNIDIQGPDQFWYTLWGSYFTRGATIYPLNGTYLAPSPPVSQWTLRLRDAPLEPGAVRQELNGVFVLDRASRAAAAATERTDD